jgi:hypothetical protein
MILDVLDLCDAAGYTTDSQSAHRLAKETVKPAKKNKLTPRSIKPTAVEPAEEHFDEDGNVKLPDPEIDDRKAHPENYAHPKGEISYTCTGQTSKGGTCGVRCYIKVDEPVLYDEAARQKLFATRGGDYTNKLCPFCVQKKPKSKQVA